MIYVTNYKKKLLVNSIEIQKIKNFLDDELDFKFKKNCLFSPYEENKILTYKNANLNLEEFLKVNKLEVKDLKGFIEKMSDKRDKSYYVFPTNIHAFHADVNCPNLNKDFENYKIDDNLPAELLEEYKSWIVKHINLLKSGDDVHYVYFQKMHHEKWGEEYNLPQYAKFKNSGVEIISAAEVHKYKLEINNIIDSIHQSDKEEFKRNLKFSYVVTIKEKKDINNNLIVKYFDELKEIGKIKDKILKFLYNYYFSNNIEQLSLSSNFLESFGFKPCDYCNSNYSVN